LTYLEEDQMTDDPLYRVTPLAAIQDGIVETLKRAGAVVVCLPEELHEGVPVGPYSFHIPGAESAEGFVQVAAKQQVVDADADDPRALLASRKRYGGFVILPQDGPVGLAVDQLLDGLAALIGPGQVDLRIDYLSQAAYSVRFMHLD
jgi:hypothetical protein